MQLVAQMIPMKSKTIGRPVNDVILFVSHKPSQCGVHQFGLATAAVLRKSNKYDFRYIECASARELQTAVKQTAPAVVIFNYHPATMSWMNRSLARGRRLPFIGIFHEVTQESADSVNTELFDFHIAPDPTLLLRNPIVFKTGRLVPRYVNEHALPEIPTIGSFGFGTPGKGFEALVQRVQAEFDTAIVRLHIPAASFADKDGANARSIAARCRSLITKPGITLETSHDFRGTNEILEFLSRNSLNAFLYEHLQGRGISSAVDLALGVGRPIALSMSSMFRHVLAAKPSIVVDKSSLREIISRGTAPLAPYVREWSEENLRWDYERIVSAVLKEARRREAADKTTAAAVWSELRTVPMIGGAVEHIGHAVAGALRTAAPVLRTAERRIATSPASERLILALRQRRAVIGGLRRARSRLLAPQRNGTTLSLAGDWVPPSLAISHEAEPVNPKPYTPIDAPAGLNRLLDDSARRLYAPALTHLAEQLPELIARKIPEANIQQAFVLDTVLRYLPGSRLPALLCVGSFDDTAAAAVKRQGLPLDEVDPVINYDLATFLTKPSCRPGTYDVVFSTSVIEHVADDVQFVRDIERLLAVGGVAVITCDFREDYKLGDRVPYADFRFYNTDHITNKLMPSIPSCELVDAPRWRAAPPDFTYDGCEYSFASLVFRKVR